MEMSRISQLVNCKLPLYVILIIETNYWERKQTVYAILSQVILFNVYLDCVLIEAHDMPT